jgi:hypothetical protein
MEVEAPRALVSFEAVYGSERERTKEPFVRFGEALVEGRGVERREVSFAPRSFQRRRNAPRG